MIVSIIGHTSAALQLSRKWVCEQVSVQLSNLTPDGVVMPFMCGTGLYSAAICANMGIEFCAAIPFEDWINDPFVAWWPAADKLDYLKLIQKAHYVWTMYDDSVNLIVKLKQLNNRVIDNSDIAIVVQGHVSDNCYSAYEYASKNKKPTIKIDPYRKVVKYENLRRYSI